MNSLEFKNPTVVENNYDFNVLRLDVYKDGTKIGNLYENYSVKLEKPLYWRLFLVDHNTMEFDFFFDVVAYLSTL